MTDKKEIPQEILDSINGYIQECLSEWLESSQDELESEWPGEGGYCEVWNGDKKPLHPSIYECKRTRGIFKNDLTFTHWSPVTILKSDQIALDVVEYDGNNAPVGRFVIVKRFGKFTSYPQSIDYSNQFNAAEVSHFAVLPE